MKRFILYTFSSLFFTFLKHQSSTPDALSMAPEGPNSGYLVLQDEESTPRCCFGLCKDTSIGDLPFPQNKILTFQYHAGEHTEYDKVYMIPVINQPLSVNRYYAIKADWRRKGQAYANSKEEDKCTFCFCWKCVRDVKPRPLNPEDIYQQFEFSAAKSFCYGKHLTAKSVASDGYPPLFMRRRGWRISGSKPRNLKLGEALGIDTALRAHLPDFNFPVSAECSKSVVVGKWYCPFVFIKEKTPKAQLKGSPFYEMTLEQRWERIFACENSHAQQNTAHVDIVVQTEMVRISGKYAIQEERNDVEGVIWFKTMDETGESIGLSSVILERIMWEEERAGWVRAKEKQVRVLRDEEYGGIAGWRNFGCYMLVESFLLKRLDGTLVLTYDFMHTHQVRCKWD